MSAFVVLYSSVARTLHYYGYVVYVLKEISIPFIGTQQRLLLSVGNDAVC